ncbi:hypothetical protein [Hymenobacter cellulosivorans]|uniref:SBBP repeat-containing protein n=1 Tax=Hymenobacter cellulosivorans TaxID=2932249 RepID=A0ABY4F6E4_9BACT|nr:hypothetical protein [Hymenobacter cellulosivorans]UOQ52239.1 hypothetical protein MUN80_21060 [Hymenobacter cellulosivorans]
MSQRLFFFLGALSTFLLSTLMVCPARGQTSAFSFAAVCGASPTGGYSYCYGTAVDGTGSLYTTGYFSGTISFGNTTLTSAGDFDIYVAKMSPSGSWLWAVRGGGSGSDKAQALALDATGNVYVTGSSFSPDANFGPTTLNSMAASVVIARLDPQGNWTWAVAAGNNGSVGRSVKVDARSNVYVAGLLVGSTPGIFGSTTLTNTGTSNAFVGKLTSGGGWQWATATTGVTTATVQLLGMAVDQAGNSYVTGSFSSGTRFGQTTLTPENNSSDVYVAKMSPAGSWLWASAGGAMGEMGVLT